MYINRIHRLQRGILVWDVKEKLKEPEISFDEWYDLYSHHHDEKLFAVKLEDNRIEMHVGEEREDLYKIIKGSQEIVWW